MKRLINFILILSIFPNIFIAQVNFDEYFLNKQLRLDYYHTGNSEKENFSFDELIEEPFWGGSRVNLIDTLNLGHYMFSVYSVVNNKLIYSRGFSSLFQEWQTTAEAKKINRSFSESLTFPFPKDSVRIEIHKRDKKNTFYKIHEFIVDPNNYFIKKDRRLKYNSFKIKYSGNSNEKLDIVFLPEGYAKDEISKFKEDCNRLAGYLFEYSPFDDLHSSINIWGIEACSEDSGIDIPKDTVWKNTILNTSYYTFDSERYVMTMDNKSVRDLAANAPYDQIYILVNTDKYGGGAIYNFYSTTVVDNRLTKQIFVHEFGHGLAGLADEYAADDTYNEFYPLDVEPWEKNITTLVNFDKKWKNLIDEETEIPTKLNGKDPLELGVYEGAGYVGKGVYRSTPNSIMRAFDSNDFNEVCKRAIIEVINFYSR